MTYSLRLDLDRILAGPMFNELIVMTESPQQSGFLKNLLSVVSASTNNADSTVELPSHKCSTGKQWGGGLCQGLFLSDAFTPWPHLCIINYVRRHKLTNIHEPAVTDSKGWSENLEWLAKIYWPICLLKNSIGSAVGWISAWQTSFNPSGAAWVEAIFNLFARGWEGSWPNRCTWLLY